MSEKQGYAQIAALDEVTSPRSTKDEEFTTVDLWGPEERGDPRSRGGSGNAALKVIGWVATSVAAVLANKWLLSSFGFPFPVLLTCWHMLAATLGTRLLFSNTSLLPPFDLAIPVSTPRQILPIAVCFSTSIVCSNAAITFLTVPFTLMLKAWTPVLIWMLQYAVGSPRWQQRVWPALVITTVGVAVSSAGEMGFSATGVALQAASTAAEAGRLVLIEKLLADNSLDLPPLTLLHHIAPISLVLNLATFLLLEWPAFSAATLPSHSPATWAIVLLSNACLLLALNLASLHVIKAASSLVLSLSAVAKNVIITVIAAGAMGEFVAPSQVGGFALSTAGAFVFRRLARTGT